MFDAGSMLVKIRNEKDIDICNQRVYVITSFNFESKCVFLLKSKRALYFHYLIQLFVLDEKIEYKLL